jgi:hypothetical protein
LSHGGAGPEFFLNRELAALAQGARFVMLQVLSGRSIGCPDYPGGRNTKIDARKINRLQVLETLWREDPGKALEYVQRWNTAYLETYRQLRALIARPAMLLWLSNRAPWDWRRESLLHEPSWGSFPQLVGSEVYIETARLFEKRLKFVTDDSPQQPLSRITGKPCPYIGTERGAKVKRLHTEFGYYPSTEAHVALAQRLEPWAKNRTARKTPPGPSPLNGRRGPASASVHPASAGRQTPPE